MLDDDRPLDGRVLARIFDKQSTRTRISFDMAARQLGGSALMLTGNEMQLAREETIADTARVISRYVDAVMIRLLDHEMVEDLAAHASVPVINGLTKWSHPCQIMADVLTYEEHKGPIAGSKVCWTGDGNNVLTSWVHAAVKFGFTLNVASPRELTVDQETRDWAADSGLVHFTTDARAAAEGADCVVTDTWVSMGDDNATKRQNLLKPYQVNGALMGLAKKDAIFMHCLPAHRGDEVTDEVIDGQRSVVFDEAENRLHAQKAILAWALG
jgi:ornithine carbamoyltransferase